MRRGAPASSRQAHAWPALLAAAALSGCLGGDLGPEPEPVDVLLKWAHRAEFAGMYVAASTGAYRAAGLEVRFAEGGPELPVARHVAEGDFEFGVASMASTLKGFEAGHDVVAVAAVYQKSPVGFFAFVEAGITHPRDIVGKRVGVSGDDEPLLRAMFQQLGLDPAGVVRVPLTLDAEPWYGGEAEVWSGYIMDEPVDARAAGREVAIIAPEDWGVHLYDDLLVVKGSLLRERPEVVEGFVRATLDGWRRALERPEEALDATMAVDPTLSRAKQRAFLEASAPLLLTGLVPLGAMDPERWRQAAATLAAAGAVPPGIDPSGAYDLRLAGGGVHGP